MQAAVSTDNTTRTIDLKVVDAPDIDVTTYHRKPRVFRPDRAIIRLTNDTFQRIDVYGGLALKSGGTSDKVRERVTYWSGSELERAPEWVRLLVAEAPAGVTAWRTEQDR